MIKLKAEPQSPALMFFLSSSLCRSLYRTNTGASTAFDASISVYNVFVVSLRNSFYRTFCCASAARNASITNCICHRGTPPLFLNYKVIVAQLYEIASKIYVCTPIKTTGSKETERMLSGIFMLQPVQRLVKRIIFHCSTVAKRKIPKSTRFQTSLPITTSVTPRIIVQTVENAAHSISSFVFFKSNILSETKSIIIIPQNNIIYNIYSK